MNKQYLDNNKILAINSMDFDLKHDRDLDSLIALGKPLYMGCILK